MLLAIHWISAALVGIHRGAILLRVTLIRGETVLLRITASVAVHLWLHAVIEHGGGAHRRAHGRMLLLWITYRTRCSVPTTLHVSCASASLILAITSTASHVGHCWRKLSLLIERRLIACEWVTSGERLWVWRHRRWTEVRCIRVGSRVDGRALFMSVNLSVIDYSRHIRRQSEHYCLME